MKTGGIGGLFFSIDHAAFLYRQLLASPRFQKDISAVAPQVEGRVLYLRAPSGAENTWYRASGEIPSQRAVGAGAEIIEGDWRDDEGDRRWTLPTPAELRHAMDHFHLPPDSESRIARAGPSGTTSTCCRQAVDAAGRSSRSSWAAT